MDSQHRTLDNTGALKYGTYIVGEDGDKFLYEQVATWTIAVHGKTNGEARANLIAKIKEVAENI